MNKRCIFCAAVLCFSQTLYAAKDLKTMEETPALSTPEVVQPVVVEQFTDAPGYIAELEGTPQGLKTALERAELLFLDGRLDGKFSPASFVIHGPEVSVFFKDNYDDHRGIVDLAAKLTAFGVVDIQVCETRTGVLGRDKTDLMPFVGTVPYGPAKEASLQQEGFLYF